jgi:hypothetical protein
MENRPAEPTMPTAEASTPIVVVGHARLPQTFATGESSQGVTLELEVDTGRHAIITVAAKSLPPLAEKLLEELLLGQRIDEGPAAPVEEFKRRYISPISRAITTAISNAYEAYSRSHANPFK